MANKRQLKKNAKRSVIGSSYNFSAYNNLPSSVSIDEPLVLRSSRPEVYNYTQYTDDLLTPKMEQLINSGASNNEIKRQMRMPSHEYSNKEINTVREAINNGKTYDNIGKAQIKNTIDAPFLSISNADKEAFGDAILKATPSAAVGKANFKPNIGAPLQYTYNSNRFGAIDKAISDSGILGLKDKGHSILNNNGYKSTASKAAKDFAEENIPKAAAKAAGEGAAEAAKTAGKEAAEKVAKKSAGDLWNLAKKNKVPQIALGVAATAWLVNKLSDSRGQQSNAQLYGQQGY